MTPTQEKALLEAVAHLLNDYDDRLDSISLAMTDGGSDVEAQELEDYRARLDTLRAILEGRVVK
jgi:hypothetical protein